MAVFSMGKLALVGSARDQGGPVASTETEAKKTLTSAMETIARFIPTDVVTIYVAGIGLFAPKTPTGKWTIFAIAAGLIPVFLLISAFEQRESGQSVAIRRVLLLFLFATVAYAAWTSALPATPFEQFSEDATRIGGFAVIVASLIIPRVAKLTGAVD